MRFNIFKNTVLLFVFVMISCASKAKNKIIPKDEIHQTTKNDSIIIVGANQTRAYLSLLKGKRVGIVANQTSVIFKKEKLQVIDVDPETNEQSLRCIVKKTQ